MKLNRLLLRVDELERRENPSATIIDVSIDRVPTIVSCYATPPDVSIDSVPTIVTFYAEPSPLAICYPAPPVEPNGNILIEVAPGLIPPPAYEINKDDIVVGASGTGSSRVRSFKPDGTERLSFNAFESSFTGGITVATADFNGDGVKDIIVAAGAGGGPRVIGFDGLTGRELFSFYAFDADYTGGVSIATGDVNFDQTVVLTVQGNMIVEGQADIIVGALHGSSHVKVFDGKTRAEISSFYAFDGFQGGVNVASAGTYTPDVNRDSYADIIVGMQSGGSSVKVFSGKDGSVLSSFLAFDAGYKGGVSVAAGDLDYDGYADIVVGSLRNGNHVKAYSGQDGSELASFFASDSGVDSGVNVAVVNNDNESNLVVGSRKGSNLTRYRSNRSPDSTVLTKVESLSVFESEYPGGISIASSAIRQMYYL